MTEPAVVSPLPVATRRRWTVRAVAALIVLALCGGAWWLVQRAKAPSAPAAGGAALGGGPGGPGGPGGGGRGGGGFGGGAGSVTVGAAVARAGDLPITLDALGTVTPVTSVALKPQVSGVLTDVLFTEGQAVKKGDVLARIDARPFEQTLAQAKAQRARDEAQLSAARVTLQRYQTLWKQDSIAKQDLDTQAALVNQLTATVQSDVANERAAQLNVNYARITAPISGRIGLRAVDPGNMMSAGSSTIATITQMSPMDVQFVVPQDRVPDVLAAQRQHKLPVTVLDRTRVNTLAQGQFSTLDNVVDPATGTVKAKARFGNGDGALFPSQFVNVRLELGTTPGVLVPVTAVRTGPQGDYVYVIAADRTAKMRTVKRGIASVDMQQITSGLNAGEQVVTEGGDRVKDGDKVQMAGDRPMRGASGTASGRGPRGGASAPMGAASAAGVAGAAAAAATTAVATPTDNKNNTAAAPDTVAAPAPAAPASRPAWFDRLPPEVQEKIKAMSPDERRAYIEQLRAARRAREGQSQ